MYELVGERTTSAGTRPGVQGPGRWAVVLGDVSGGAAVALTARHAHVPHAARRSALIWSRLRSSIGTCAATNVAAVRVDGGAAEADVPRQEASLTADWNPMLIKAGRVFWSVTWCCWAWSTSRSWRGVTVEIWSRATNWRSTPTGRSRPRRRTARRAERAAWLDGDASRRPGGRVVATRSRWLSAPATTMLRWSRSAAPWRSEGLRTQVGAGAAARTGAERRMRPRECRHGAARWRCSSRLARWRSCRSARRRRPGATVVLLAEPVTYVIGLFGALRYFCPSVPLAPGREARRGRCGSGADVVELLLGPGAGDLCCGSGFDMGTLGGVLASSAPRGVRARYMVSGS